MEYGLFENVVIILLSDDVVMQVLHSSEYLPFACSTSGQLLGSCQAVFFMSTEIPPENLFDILIPR